MLATFPRTENTQKYTPGCGFTFNALDSVSFCFSGLFCVFGVAVSYPELNCGLLGVRDAILIFYFLPSNIKRKLL